METGPETSLAAAALGKGNDELADAVCSGGDDEAGAAAAIVLKRRLESRGTGESMLRNAGLRQRLCACFPRVLPGGTARSQAVFDMLVCAVLRGAETGADLLEGASVSPEALSVLAHALRGVGANAPMLRSADRFVLRAAKTGGALDAAGATDMQVCASVLSAHDALSDSARTAIVAAARMCAERAASWADVRPWAAAALSEDPLPCALHVSRAIESSIASLGGVPRGKGGAGTLRTDSWWSGTPGPTVNGPHASALQSLLEDVFGVLAVLACDDACTLAGFQVGSAADVVVCCAAAPEGAPHLADTMASALASEDARVRAAGACAAWRRGASVPGIGAALARMLVCPQSQQTGDSAVHVAVGAVFAARALGRAVRATPAEAIVQHSALLGTHSLVPGGVDVARDAGNAVRALIHALGDASASPALRSACARALCEAAHSRVTFLADNAYIAEANTCSSDVTAKGMYRGCSSDPTDKGMDRGCSSDPTDKGMDRGCSSDPTAKGVNGACSSDVTAKGADRGCSFDPTAKGADCGCSFDPTAKGVHCGCSKDTACDMGLPTGGTGAVCVALPSKARWLRTECIARALVACAEGCSVLSAHVLAALCAVRPKSALPLVPNVLRSLVAPDELSAAPDKLSVAPDELSVASDELGASPDELGAAVALAEAVAPHAATDSVQHALGAVVARLLSKEGDVQGHAGAICAAVGTGATAALAGEVSGALLLSLQNVDGPPCALRVAEHLGAAGVLGAECVDVLLHLAGRSPGAMRVLAVSVAGGCTAHVSTDVLLDLGTQAMLAGSAPMRGAACALVSALAAVSPPEFGTRLVNAALQPPSAPARGRCRVCVSLQGTAIFLQAALAGGANDLLLRAPLIALASHARGLECPCAGESQSAVLGVLADAAERRDSPLRDAIVPGAADLALHVLRHYLARPLDVLAAHSACAALARIAKACGALPGGETAQGVLVAVLGRLDVSHALSSDESLYGPCMPPAGKHAPRGPRRFGAPPHPEDAFLRPVCGWLLGRVLVRTADSHGTAFSAVASMRTAPVVRALVCGLERADRRVLGLAADCDASPDCSAAWPGGDDALACNGAASPGGTLADARDCSDPYGVRALPPHMRIALALFKQAP